MRGLGKLKFRILAEESLCEWAVLLEGEGVIRRRHEWDLADAVGHQSLELAVPEIAGGILGEAAP